jgi:tRNA(Ile)-lysidine synthase
VRRAVSTLAGALGPGLVPALARTAELLREDADALEDLADRLLTDVLRPGGAPEPGSGPSLALAVDPLLAAAPAIRRRALLAALRLAGVPAGALGRRHVLAVDALLIAWRGQGPVHLPGRVVARRDCGRLLLSGWAGVGREAGGQPREEMGCRRPPLVERE